MTQLQVIARLLEGKIEDRLVALDMLAELELHKTCSAIRQLFIQARIPGNLQAVEFSFGIFAAILEGESSLWLAPLKGSRRRAAVEELESYVLESNR